MKTPQTNDSLAKAIAYLGAVEVAPGRYAFTGVNGYGEPRWLIGTAEQISCPEDMPIIEAVMPAWWTPEHQTERRCPHGRLDHEACQDSNCGLGWHEGQWQRITVDLETGAEVPACD